MRLFSNYLGFLSLSLVLSSAQLQGQANQTPKTAYHSLHPGLELDALPFVLGGYGGSVWLGFKRSRLDLYWARFNYPSFLLPATLGPSRLKVTGLSMDFFFDKQFKGWWVGPGFQQWVQSGPLTQQPALNYTHRSIVFTCAGGYQWFFWKGFYLSPYLAVHTRLSGTKPLRLDGQTYQPPLILPEFSLRLGWKF